MLLDCQTLIFIVIWSIQWVRRSNDLTVSLLVVMTTEIAQILLLYGGVFFSCVVGKLKIPLKLALCTKKQIKNSHNSIQCVDGLAGWYESQGRPRERVTVTS